MVKRNLHLDFGTEKVVIELLNTPLVDKWVTAYTAYKNHLLTSDSEYKDFKIELARIFGHETGYLFGEEGDAKEPSTGLTVQETVDEINKAIDEINELVDGLKFPFRAFTGMTWEQSNLIHRCFTTASSSNTNWQHLLNPIKLAQFKKDAYESKLGIQDYITETQFKIKRDCYPLYVDALARINKFIHLYEYFHISERTSGLVKGIKAPVDYLELNWDNFTSAGRHSFHYSERATYEELLESFPTNYKYEEYDVFFGKSIAGKDYEDAYSHYDNPLEYDITNIDGIDGSVRIHNSPTIREYYKDTSDFINWCNQNGIDRKMYLPVPLGKIIYSSVDLTTIKKDFGSLERWSNGMVKCFAPFNKLKSYLVVG